MTTNGALDAGVAESDTGDDADVSPGRVSRIVEIVEREARPVTGVEELRKTRNQEFEIETDLDESGPMAAAAKGAEVQAARAALPADAANADEIIEVTDAEIEAVPTRSTQPSPRQSAAPPIQRSRPPERPSARPRGSVVPSAPGLLPPPRSSSPGFPSPFGSVPPAASASGPVGGSVDPWLLANRTLELSRAQARIAELEEFVAFRDARIVALEEQLAETESKLRELEQRQGPRSEGARSRPTVASVPEAATQPKPSTDTARPIGLPRAVVVAEAAPKRAAVPKQAAPEPQSAPAQVAEAATPVAKHQEPAPAPSKRESTSEVTVIRTVTTPSAPAPTVRSTAPALAPELAPVPAAAPAPVKALVELEARGAAPADASPDSEPEDSTDAAELESLPAPFAAPARGGSNSDELRSIAGIGPRFEAALRKQGITRLAQIAAWSEDDVRQVAKALKIPKSRIVKGRWVESAREAIGTRAASE